MWCPRVRHSQMEFRPLGYTPSICDHILLYHTRDRPWTRAACDACRPPPRRCSARGLKAVGSDCTTLSVHYVRSSFFGACLALF